MAKNRPPFTIRRIRQAALFLALLVISFWGYANYRADNFTFAWTAPVRVLIVALADPGVDLEDEAARGFFHRFLSEAVPGSGNVEGIGRWFRDEYRRQTGKEEDPLEFTVRGPVRTSRPPPLASDGGSSFYERWRGTKAFLDYFEELGRREGFVLEAYDAAIFVYFFNESESSRFRYHTSAASRRNRRGVVFSPLGESLAGRCCVLLVHELCHTLGAADKYEGERSLFPDGFADPEMVPPYPQVQAEIMALGIPVAPGRERRVEDLGDCAMGKKTAEEIGWRKPGR